MSSSPPGLVYGLENDFQAGSEAPGQGRHSITVHLEPLPAASIYRIEIDLILYRYARHAWQVSERALLSTFFRRSPRERTPLCALRRGGAPYHRILPSRAHLAKPALHHPIKLGKREARDSLVDTDSGARHAWIDCSRLISTT